MLTWLAAEQGFWLGQGLSKGMGSNSIPLLHFLVPNRQFYNHRTTTCFLLKAWPLFGSLVVDVLASLLSPNASHPLRLHSVQKYQLSYTWACFKKADYMCFEKFTEKPVSCKCRNCRAGQEADVALNTRWGNSPKTRTQHMQHITERLRDLAPASGRCTRKSIMLTFFFFLFTIS